MSDLDVDVLVVGGGGAGLSASIFLSDLGVDHVLVERNPATSQLPKAHYLNARTLEIFRQHGVSEAVYAAGMPLGDCKVRFCTSLGGDGPLDARELYVYDAFGGGSMRAAYESAAPGPPTNLPQIRLEPLLRKLAEDGRPGGFGSVTSSSRSSRTSRGRWIDPRGRRRERLRGARAIYDRGRRRQDGSGGSRG